jgi:L-ribulose-5-phosphate 3-epimerase
MKNVEWTWPVPFAAGVAVQRYLTAEEGLAKAQLETCSHWYVDASLIEDMPHNWTGRRRQALRDSAREQGMSPILHGNFRAPLATEIPEVRAAALEYVRTEIQLAVDIEATAYVIHGGAFVEPRPTKAHRDAALDRFFTLLAVAQQEAASRGIAVWLENLSYYPKYRPFSYVFTREGDYSVALQHIPELKFILDVGHANVSQDMALPVFEKYASSIAALSLSNNSGGQDSHLALREGTLSMPRLAEAIRSSQWSGIIAFETRNEDVVDGLAYLEQLWNSGSSAVDAVEAGRDAMANHIG